MCIYRLQAAAWEKYEEIKEQTATTMKHVMNERKYMQVNIDLKPSRILLPHSGIYKEYVLYLVRNIFKINLCLLFKSFFK